LEKLRGGKSQKRRGKKIKEITQEKKKQLNKYQIIKQTSATK